MSNIVKLWLTVILLFVIGVSTPVEAQINKVLIQASGLTCSMCSNSIHKSLKTLAAVATVNANIKNSTFEISFNPNASIDIDELKKKVEDAGFFVARFEIQINVNEINVEDDAHVEWDNKLFHFIHVGQRKLKGMVTLLVLDKGYVPDKEFKRNARYTTMGCYQTGYKGPCCNDKTSSTLQRIYHVTI